MNLRDPFSRLGPRLAADRSRSGSGQPAPPARSPAAGSLFLCSHPQAVAQRHPLDLLRIDASAPTALDNRSITALRQPASGCPDEQPAPLADATGANAVFYPQMPVMPRTSNSAPNDNRAAGLVPWVARHNQMASRKAKSREDSCAERRRGGVGSVRRLRQSAFIFRLASM